LIHFYKRGLLGLVFFYGYFIYQISGKIMMYAAIAAQFF